MQGQISHQKFRPAERRDGILAAKAIKAAVGVVEQYKRIAAQPAKHKKEEPEPAPEA